jgi:hypothetical protein
VNGRRVAVHGALRGPGQERKPDYLRHEWSTGPYDRTVTLPTWLDAARTNATYANGVLVVILPVTGRRTSGRITLDKVGTARGRLRRHIGRDLHAPEEPRSTTALGGSGTA